MALRRAQFAIGGYAASQQIVQQPLLELLELLDNRLGLADGGVERASNLRDLRLLVQRRKQQRCDQ